MAECGSTLKARNYSKQHWSKTVESCFSIMSVFQYFTYFYCGDAARLGVALHNLAHKSKDAIKTFKQILELDSGDHLVRIAVSATYSNSLCSSHSL